MPLFDLYFNGHDGARYMLPDIEAPNASEAARAFVTGTFEREPTHRFVAGRESLETSDELSVHVFDQENEAWTAFDDDELNASENVGVR